MTTQQVEVPDMPPANEQTSSEAHSALPLKPGVLIKRVGYRTRLMQSVLTDRVVAGFHPYELKPGSYTTMALMSANPGCSQTELARAGGLDKSAIVAILDVLEARNLAIRGRSREDRRRNALFLTAQGEQLIAEMAKVAHDSEQPLQDEFTAEELTTLLNLLDRAYLALTKASNQ
jgi:DNA-binding MarR family transcriptional regulator